VKAQEMAMRRVAERQGQLQFYKEVVNDVSTLPENHYKWSNFYSRLGVPDRAKFSDVKKNYRKLCLLYHPDKTGDQNDKILQDKFQGIKEAYERISESHGV
jgi:preprotein translocase subunit Sec63